MVTATATNTKKKREKKDYSHETPQDTLKRLAPARVSKALKAIRLLGSLHRYDMTPAQEDAILNAIAKEVKALQAVYAGSPKGVEAFTLPQA